MNFDLRLPIGILFGLIGLILTIFGAVAPRTIYRASLGLNVNLGWGLVLLAFGLTMLGFALRARRR